MNATILILALSLFSQQASAPPPLEPTPGYTVDYQMGPGDLLSIQVSGLREFNQTTRVSNSGRIHVPYVGIMMVAGMTALQVEREIATKIKEHELVNEPAVRVQVEQHRARPTYVIGQVSAPGQFMITSEMYLLDLLSKAGGLLGSAGDIGYLYRRNSLQPEVRARLIAAGENSTDQAAAQPVTVPVPDNAEQVTSIDLNELRAGTRPDLNVKLQGGDVVYIPLREPSTIYIIGDVKVPGAYGLPRRGEITAAQAVIYAGGPLATARMSNGFIMRHDEGGVRQSIPVDFAAIIQGKRPDLPVKPDDIIFIPSSGAKTIGVALFNMLPRLLQQFLIF